MKKYLIPIFFVSFSACAQTELNDWFYNPFTASSAHHRPIGSGATYAGDADQTTQDWMARPNEFVLNTGIPHGPEVVDSDTSDPAYTITWGGQSGNGDTALPVGNIHIPSGELLFDGSLSNADAPAAIYLRNEETVHEFRKWQWNNGSPTSSGYFSNDIKGLGHGTAPGERVGFGAIGASHLFGLLRGWEINTPGQKISHALAVAAANRGNCSHLYGKTFQWPATSMDAGWDDPENNLGSVPYGALFAIPPMSKGGPDLNSLGLSEPGLRLAEALRDYGVYMKEGNGCNHTTIYADQHVGEDMMFQLRQDSALFYPYLRMVTNNDSSLDVAGGGTPLATNTAIDAQDTTPPPSGETGFIPKTGWSLVYTDSEETAQEDGRAINAFDGNPQTLWHSGWSVSVDPLPHQMVINLGGAYRIDGFRYLPRQDGGDNGRVKDYAIYVSRDGFVWSAPISSGVFVDDATEKEVVFDMPVIGRFVRFVALSDFKDFDLTAMAELTLLGEAVQ